MRTLYESIIDNDEQIKQDTFSEKDKAAILVAQVFHEAFGDLYQKPGDTEWTIGYIPDESEVELEEQVKKFQRLFKKKIVGKLKKKSHTSTGWQSRLTQHTFTIELRPSRDELVMWFITIDYERGTDNYIKVYTSSHDLRKFLCSICTK